MDRGELLGREDVEDGSNSWQLHFDDEVQSYFYYNTETGETKWAPEMNPGTYNDEYNDGSSYLDELDGNVSIGGTSRVSTLSVVDRSAQMLAQKKVREEALRQELLLREKQEMRDAPAINERSKKLNRGIDDIFAWEEQRKQRMEALAQQRLAEESAQNTGRPMLYGSSNASVISTNSGGSGSGSGVPVEERLRAYEEKRQLKLQATRAKEVQEARRSAIPTISQHSANLARRRAATGYETPSRPVLTAQDVPGILRDQSTGQTLFQPKLNRKSQQIAASVRPHMPVEDLLNGKGRLQKQRQAEREQRLQQREQALRSVSKVNAKSEKLVQTRYILQGETTQDRLSRGIGAVRTKTLEEINRPTFKPTLNPNSIEMANAASGVNFHYSAEEADTLSPQQASFERFHGLAQSTEYDPNDGPLLYEDIVRGSGGGRSGGGASVEDRMYLKSQRWQEARQQKLDKERKERERQQRQACTFKPQIDANKVPVGYRDQRGVDSYLERQASWMERREQKLEEERRRAAEKEVEGCSFAPQRITAPSGAGDRPGRGANARKPVDVEGPYYADGTPAAAAGSGRVSTGMVGLHDYGQRQQPQQQHQQHQQYGQPVDPHYSADQYEVEAGQGQGGYLSAQTPSKVPLPVKARIAVPTSTVDRTMGSRSQQEEPWQSGHQHNYQHQDQHQQLHLHRGVRFLDDHHHQVDFSEPEEERHDQDQYRQQYEYEDTDEPDEGYSGLPIRDSRYPGHGATGIYAGYSQQQAPWQDHHQQQQAWSTPQYAPDSGARTAFNANRGNGYDASFAEPDEEGDYGDVSLYDIGGLSVSDTRPSAVDECTNSPAALITGVGRAQYRLDDPDLPPPPPPPSTQPHHVTFQGLPAHTPARADVRYMHDSDGDGGGVEFSPSPVRPMSRSAMYDIL